MHKLNRPKQKYKLIKYSIKNNVKRVKTISGLREKNQVMLTVMRRVSNLRRSVMKPLTKAVALFFPQCNW